MTTSSYAWGNGKYYDYGWFVPPIALYLLLRRWKESSSSPTRPLAPWSIIGWLLVFAPTVFVFRSLHYADPLWRLPMGALATMAVLTTHGFLAASKGWKASLSFWLVTGLALSAIPWPIPIENRMVQELTHGVIVTVTEIFQWLGKPVVMTGDRLQLHAATVEVTDGCSGIRSFQSFLMAALFFAEFQRLRWQAFLKLLLYALITAFLINVFRTWLLAEIRFTRGETAFNDAHDVLGLGAFLVSGFIFYVISGKLAEHPKRQIIIIRQQR